MLFASLLLPPDVRFWMLVPRYGLRPGFLWVNVRQSIPLPYRFGPVLTLLGFSLAPLSSS
jgi:hypothetical protein